MTWRMQPQYAELRSFPFTIFSLGTQSGVKSSPLAKSLRSKKFEGVSKRCLFDAASDYYPRERGSVVIMGNGKIRIAM